jgi:beta-glucosidase
VSGNREARAAVLPYQDPAVPVAARVSDLLGRMSLDEKIGQMT